MPSRRSRFETACRIGAFGLLGWLLGGSVIPSTGRRVERADTRELATRLDAWTRAPGNLIVHADLATTPEPWATQWLGALRRSGRSVTWSGTPPAAVLSVEPIVDPNGGARIDIAAPDGGLVAVSDDASPIDSVHLTNGNLGGTVVSPVVVGAVRATIAGETLRVAADESAIVRPVMVVGAAGWEGKYVVSALEERGWPVIARFTVAPNVDVTQGTLAALDTARVSVLIAIDSTISTLGPAVERFARSGGGVILAGASGSVRNVAEIVPGEVAPRTRPNVKPTDTLRLGTTGFYPVAHLSHDGVVLEKRDNAVAVAARRVGAGRVIQVGYDDSWRWRMAGVAGSEAAHREFWSRLAAAVAYAPVNATARGIETAAPRAALVAQLGAPRDGPPEAPRPPVDRRILMTLMMILLLAEWASRRLRGLR
jgi:hypothetical protein